MRETAFSASVVRAHPNGRPEIVMFYNSDVTVVVELILGDDGRIVAQSGNFPDGVVSFRLGQDLVRVPVSKGKFHGRMQVTRGSTTKHFLYQEGQLAGDAPEPGRPGPAAKPEAKPAPPPGAQKRCSLCGEAYASLADHVRSCVGGGLGAG